VLGTSSSIQHPSFVPLRPPSFVSTASFPHLLARTAGRARLCLYREIRGVVLADRELCRAELGRIRASPVVLSSGRGARGSDSSGDSSYGGILVAARAPGGTVAERRRQQQLSHGRAEAVPSMAGELGWLGLPALGGGTGRLASPQTAF